MNSPERERGDGSRGWSALLASWSLREGRADDLAIDRSLRAGVGMTGARLWVLMLAIFIASIGLNVNSTAVVIGAMLISPLMGPILGVGYGVGIYDFPLVRDSLRNLATAAMLALVTSTAYFLLSPLTVVQPELLARTSPTLWDVLIAVFGGLAGLVATTRKEDATVIPGVAIATALMPPLCTAGFGLATRHWHYFLGAIYLFTIDGVFIAASSAFVVRALRLPRKHFVDERAARRVRRYVGAAVVVTLLPSLYLAYQLVAAEVFKARATEFVRQQLESDRTHVVAVTADPRARRIEATLVGDVLTRSAVAAVAGRLSSAGLAGAGLRVFQAGEDRIDVAALRSDLLRELYEQSRTTLEQKDKLIDQLRGEVASSQAARERFRDVPAELHAVDPRIVGVRIADAPDWNATSGWSAGITLLVTVRTSAPLGRGETDRITGWLRVRLKTDAVRLIVESDR